MASGIRVTLRMEGGPHSLAAFAEVLPAFRSDVLTGAATFTEREARLAAPRDTSALARSIASVVHTTTAVVSTNLVYAATMEFGRRPGAKMPPPAALRGWARRHGMAGREFVLARAIARRGIHGRFYMRKAVERLLSHGFAVIVPAATRRALAAWHQQAGK